MKTKISLAIATVLLAGTVSAAPTFYGEVDVSLDYLPENNNGSSDRDVVELSSNNSFIGIKGEEKLNDRLSALYQSEWTIYVDDGVNGADPFVPRNQVLGLKDAKLGTLKVGKIDTPVKQLSSFVDSFNNSVENTADVAGLFSGENRIDNVVVYESPSFNVAEGQLRANLLLATGEAGGIATSKGGAKVAGRGLGDALSTSVVFDNKIVVVGLGYDAAIPSNFLRKGYLNASQTETNVSGVFAAANNIRAIGRLNLDNGLSLRALYQNAEVEDKAGNAAAAATIDDENAWLIGAEYKIPTAKNWTVRGQYSQTATSFNTTRSDVELSQLIVGADYAFTKQFKAYGHAGYLTLEEGSAKDSQVLVGTGLEFKF